MNKKVFIIIAFVFIGVYAMYTYMVGSQNPNRPPVSNEDINTASQTIQDPDLGFSVQLPQDFSVEKNGQFSRLFTKNNSTDPVGSRSFIYLSVVPLTQITEEGAIYNYSKNDYEKLLKTQVGEQVVLGNSPDQNLNMFFTYTRSEGKMVGGYGANEYINTKPWEFPTGTTEYRYIIPFSSSAYIIGGYLAADSSNGVTKSEFEQIISTLKLTPDTIRLVQVTPVADGDWKIFSDAKNEISFKYPSNWKIQNSSQFFENGDIFAIQAIGQTQRPQTELYDGASFAVMRPIVSDMEIVEWMKSHYEKNEPVDSSRPPRYESVSYGGMRYEKVTVCGLGCFPYYHLKRNGKIYGFLGFAAGPNEAVYLEVIDKILSSVSYID